MIFMPRAFLIDGVISVIAGVLSLLLIQTSRRAIDLQVCQQQGVPLDVVPLTSAYWDRVVTHCVHDIRNGRTPNPDVLCNSRVKFGAFYDFLESNHAGRFDRIASGHYARLDRSDDESCPVTLHMTPDAMKDQTYFLAHLTQRQLSRVMFPLGFVTKRQVRSLAHSADLATKHRRDSQGICFLGKVKFSEFVREHLGVWRGPVVEEESNKVVAQHDGFWFYTIGQRSGLNLGELPNGPWYVVRKDPKWNAIYVSRNYFSEDKVRKAFVCGSLSWITALPADVLRHGCILGEASNARDKVPLQVKVRHGSKAYECSEFKLFDNARRVVVRLPESDQGLAAGQYAVFYRDGKCLGSGVIEEGFSTLHDMDSDQTSC